MKAKYDVTTEDLMTPVQKDAGRRAAPTILTDNPCALPADLATRTEILTPTAEAWLERGLRRTGLPQAARRIRALRRGWTMFRRARKFDVVITIGDLQGLFFASLQRLLKGRQRPVHVMHDCLWYGGGRLKRAWMRFCLGQVDTCVVWASVECDRYARAYGVPREKFFYVPHHHTLDRYRYELGDEGYVFTGGNSDRDYGLFFAAVRDLSVHCVLATNNHSLMAGLEVPSNVQVVSVSAAGFRQLMARARIVVLPMRATLLHVGGQQSILNAMLMAKAVVSTDPAGGADYIDPGRTGIVVPYGDPIALRDAINWLAGNREEARAMGERARLSAEPLTTERSNIAIWRHALQLAQERKSGCGNHVSR